MSADPRQIDAHARRLVETVGDTEPFRDDPQATVESVFGIEVRYRDNVLSDCDIDGSYDHKARLITVDARTIATRRRFTILHELGHALVRYDAMLADWLIHFDEGGRHEEERVANAFASLILLPDSLVDHHIPAEGPCAFDILQLAEASNASREAACVRASQKLRSAGLVVLSQGSTVQLAISRGLPFGLRRRTDMGPDSFFADAATREATRRSGIRLRFADTENQSSRLEADAATDDRGYTFSVLMETGAPWVSMTAVPSGPLGHEIDCDLCDGMRITFRAECPTCGDRPCPDHGCSCDRPAPATVRRCQVCFMELPSAAPDGVDLCDFHA